MPDIGSVVGAAADVAAICAAFGGIIMFFGVASVAYFARRRPAPAAAQTPVTVLKPLCGDEPGLEAGLASFFTQDHRHFQIVVGVQDEADPALATVRRLSARFPRADLTLVIDPTLHGMNRKIGNLLNMLPAARHDTLVFADSDLHVAPDYLRRLQAALARPGVGLVTTVYVGRPAVPGWAARLGAMHLSHTFLPGALLSRAMGRQDCLGSTMALTRDTLHRCGGLAALSPHLADDNVLGQLVSGLGLSVTLADTVPVTAVQERRMGELWSHELRWARTIGALAPLAYAASALQYPLAWALLACALSGGRPWALLLVGLCWAARGGAARATDRLLRDKMGARAPSLPTWLLPLRDLMSVAEVFASYRGRRVMWRGHAMHADPGRVRPAREPVADLPGGLAAAMTRTVGGLLLGLSCGFALAQPPTAAQQQAVKQSCRADFQAHCAGVPPGGSAALACLKQNAASLSPGCRSAVVAIGAPATPQTAAHGAAKPPAPTAEAAARPPGPPASLGMVRRACAADYREYCRGVRPVLMCLKANAQRLSPTCQQSLMSLRQ